MRYSHFGPYGALADLDDGNPTQLAPPPGLTHPKRRLSYGAAPAPPRDPRTIVGAEPFVEVGASRSKSKGKQRARDPSNMESAKGKAERELRAAQAGTSRDDEYKERNPRDRSAILRNTAVKFCAALTDPSSNPPAKILSTFFIPNTPRITEHGPDWANERLPFLARTFQGTSDGDGTCLDYFAKLSDYLKMDMKPESFPPENEFAVDTEAVADGAKGGVVCVVSRPTRFESIMTGKNWTEKFVYRLSGFDEEGRIGHWVSSLMVCKKTMTTDMYCRRYGLIR